MTMVDPVAIPILMRAVDFLFDEAGKVLQERRERRGKGSLPPAREMPSSQKAIRSKEEALKVPVDFPLWKQREGKVKHLLALLDIYVERYRLAREQYAQFGSAMVPPIIVHNLNEAEQGVIETVEMLQDILGEIYHRKVEIPVNDMLDAP